MEDEAEFVAIHLADTDEEAQLRDDRDFDREWVWDSDGHCHPNDDVDESVPSSVAVATLG